MSDAELSLLEQKYHASLRTLGGLTRAETLKLPLTESELKLLKDYIVNTDLPINTVASNAGLTPAQVYNRVSRLACKFLHQNKDKIVL